MSERTKLYSPIVGEVELKKIRNDKDYPIITKKGVYNYNFTAEGFYYHNLGEECLLFPSKDQRDWSKFTASWYKKERFDPKTFMPFDRVLVRSEKIFNWNCSLFSNIDDFSSEYPFSCLGTLYRFCIPCNDYTKHLIGTTEEAPEFYRYWED